MNDIFVSKIVGSPTETSWSQSSSTGKLYIALSLSSSEENGGIIAKGKNVLEQIQREFFAIDDKNLSEIKKAVEKVFTPLNDVKYSAVVGAIKDDVLYIVTASAAVVLIERENNLAEVARGEEGKIIGFSGKLKHDDVLILETEEFHRKISNKLLAEYTGSHNNERLAEDLAPFILENSKGEEAAIIIHYKDPHNRTPVAHMPSPSDHHEDERVRNYASDEITDEYNEEEPTNKERPNLFAGITSRFKNISKKQKGIAIFAVLIVLILLGSLFGERFMDQRREVEAEFESVYTESTQKLESAKNLSSLNRGRALEEVNSAISQLEASLGKFSEGSDEYEKLNSLLTELRALRDELGGGSEVAGTSIFTLSDSKVLKNISHITASNENIIVIGDAGYALINADGELESEEEAEISSSKRAISDENNIYLLSSNVNRVTISNSNISEIIEDTSDAIDISYFGSNIYLLNNGGEGIIKYSGSSYQKSNYLTDGTDLNGNPIAFAIDGSVYILNDSASIQKFTRGALADDFELDSTIKISKNALLYTNENLSNLYILDIDNSSVVQISKSGKVNKQFNSNNIQNAKSFTISADESKVLVVADDQVYSFDL